MNTPLQSRSELEAVSRHLLDLTDDGLIVCDARARILFANRALRAACGRELTGRSLFELVTPASRAALEQSLTRWNARGSAGDAPASLELALCASGPAAKPIALRVQSSPSGATGFCGHARLAAPGFDWGAAREFEPAALAAKAWQALQQSERFTLALSELDSGRLLAVNRAFELRHGVPAERVVGKTAVELGLVTSQEHADYIARIHREGASELNAVAVRSIAGRNHKMLLQVSKLSDVEPALALTVGTDITEYAEAVARAHAADQRFRAVFEHLDDAMFFFDEQGRFFDVNSAACAQLGYERQELLRLCAEDIVSPLGTRTSTSMTQAAAELQGKAQWHLESVHRTKDGRLFPVEVTLCVFTHAGRRAVAAIARDVTDKRRIEAEVREARDRMQAVLQALPDLLFEIDEHGVIQDFYSSRTDQLTMPVSQFLHRNLSELSAPEVSSVIMGAVRAAIAHGHASGAQYKVGNGRWFELSAARRAGAPGQVARVIALARDITERKQYEQELQRSNDELLRFTYTVSHDLKSPLVTIRSFAGLLRTDLAKGDSERIERDLLFIEKAASRMQQLLDDLLQLSRVGRQCSPHQRVSLKQLVQDACDMLAGQIAQSGARVEVTPTPVSLLGERTRLMEVLQNLIDNAIKFAKPEKAPHISVTVEPADNRGQFVISVRDEGIGIDPRHKQRLFGLFEKLHPEASGTGLGLALVKRIIEVHGGSVWIESAGEGAGAAVRFTFPNITLEDNP